MYKFSCVKPEKIVHFRKFHYIYKIGIIVALIDYNSID